jgi:hypothetical protein
MCVLPRESCDCSEWRMAVAVEAKRSRQRLSPPSWRVSPAPMFCERRHGIRIQCQATLTANCDRLRLKLHKTNHMKKLPYKSRVDFSSYYPLILTENTAPPSPFPNSQSRHFKLKFLTKNISRSTFRSTTTHFSLPCVLFTSQSPIQLFGRQASNHEPASISHTAPSSHASDRSSWCKFHSLQCSSGPSFGSSFFAKEQRRYSRLPHLSRKSQLETFRTHQNLSSYLSPILLDAVAYVKLSVVSHTTG